MNFIYSNCFVGFSLELTYFLPLLGKTKTTEKTRKFIRFLQVFSKAAAAANYPQKLGTSGQMAASLAGYFWDAAVGPHLF